MISRGVGLFTCATLIAVVGSMSAVTVAASNGRSMSVDERIRGADAVVVATVQSVSPGWRENLHGDRLIVSRVLLRVGETLKGSPADVAWMDLEGGTLDGVTLRVSSLPNLEAGERAVFMLHRMQSGVDEPYLRGLGILKLDREDRVRGSSLSLAEVRRIAAAAGGR